MPCIRFQKGEVDAPRACDRWVRQLGHILESYPGVQKVFECRYAIPDELAQPASQTHLMSLGEVVDQLESAGAVDGSLRELYHAAEHEMMQGVSVRMGRMLL